MSVVIASIFYVLIYLTLTAVRLVLLKLLPLNFLLPISLD